MGGCQNYGRFLGTLNIRCRIIIRIQRGTIILTTTHIDFFHFGKCNFGQPLCTRRHDWSSLLSHLSDGRSVDFLELFDGVFFSVHVGHGL